MNYLAALPRQSGLNNQRISLIGLINSASKEGCGVVLPSHLRDFKPKPFTNNKIKWTDVFTVFDKKTLFDYLNLSDIPFIVHNYENSELSPNVKLINDGDIFTGGARLVQKISNNPEILNLIGSFKPSVMLLEEANSIFAQLSKGTVGLQFRVENDWQYYLDRVAGGGYDNDEEFLNTDIEKIFLKLKNTIGIDVVSIYACCDENDLPLSIDQIKSLAIDFGIRLFFKSDFVLNREFMSSLQLSMIDFALCGLFQIYIGLSRSTFSNMVSMYAHSITNKRHYVYNNPGKTCFLRQDGGRKLTPWLKSRGQPA